MWMLGGGSTEDRIIELLFDFPSIIFTVGGALAVVIVLITSIAGVLTARYRSRAAREIAAYVAEGSIEPERAVELLKVANESTDSSCC